MREAHADEAIVGNTTKEQVMEFSTQGDVASSGESGVGVVSVVDHVADCSCIDCLMCRCDFCQKVMEEQLKNE